MTKEISDNERQQNEEPIVWAAVEDLKDIRDKPLSLAEVDRPVEDEGLTTIELSNGDELTMTRELGAAVEAIGLERLEHDLISLFARIAEDPFGPTNIDEFKDTDAGQMARLVHRVIGPLASIVPGKELAVKTTGLDMERTRKYLELAGPQRSLLKDQFRATYSLRQKQDTQAPEGVGGIVDVLKVYGLVSRKDSDGKLQEWMLMDYIPHAQAVENIPKVLSRGGIAMTFSAIEHPDLALLAEPSRKFEQLHHHDTVAFRHLSDELSGALGDYSGSFSDLNGNNLLQSTDSKGVSRYTVIDIESHS